MLGENERLREELEEARSQRVHQSIQTPKQGFVIRDQVQRVLFREDNVKSGDKDLVQALGVLVENRSEAVNLDKGEPGVVRI